MERLIYISARGHRVSLGKTGTFRLVNVDDIGGLSATSQVFSGPFQDGTTPEGDPYFEAKVLAIEVLIVSSNITEAYRQLSAILNPKQGLGKLIYEVDGAATQYGKVRTRMLPTKPAGDGKGDGYQMTSFMLEVFDPLFTDLDYTEADVSSGGNSFTFPLNISDSYVFDYLNATGIIVDNQGDLETPVIVSMDGPLSAPLVIENETSGEKIVTQLAIADGERLTVSTEPDNLNVTLTTIATGAESVAFQYIDVSQTDFFQLALGPNTIKITAAGADVAAATVKFKNRYVSSGGLIEVPGDFDGGTSILSGTTIDGGDASGN